MRANAKSRFAAKAAAFIVTLAMAIQAADAESLSTPHLVVFATAKVKQGAEEEFKRVVSGLVTRTRVEPGNIRYLFHQSREDSTLFAFYEQWKDERYLDAHLNSTYMKAFFTEVEAFFEPGFPQIKRFQSVEP